MHDWIHNYLETEWLNFPSQVNLSQGEKEYVKGKLDEISFLRFMLDNNTFKDQNFFA